MTPRIDRRYEADRDLEAHAFYIARRNPAAAERFLNASEEALGLLAEFPELGSPCSFKNPAWSNLRSWALRRFRNYVIYYRPLPEGIEVVRVLHGAQDVEHVFG
jgi:toxin ParE1/3/4